MIPFTPQGHFVPELYPKTARGMSSLKNSSLVSGVMSCSCEWWIMKPSLCLEVAERPQWPRLYLLGRPRSCGHMPSLVGNLSPWPDALSAGLGLWMYIDFGTVKVVHFKGSDKVIMCMLHLTMSTYHGTPSRVTSWPKCQPTFPMKWLLSNVPSNGWIETWKPFSNSETQHSDEPRSNRSVGKKVRHSS